MSESILPKKQREFNNHHFDSTIWNDFAFRNDDIYLPITRMPLAEVREAHRRIEAQETVGKVILQP